MANSKTYQKFSVILNFPAESLHAEMFAPLCSTVRVTESGEHLLHLWCSEVDSTHPVYLLVTAHKPISDNTLQPSNHPWTTIRLRIPHQYVLMILEPPFDEKGLLGFQT